MCNIHADEVIVKQFITQLYSYYRPAKWDMRPQSKILLCHWVVVVVLVVAVVVVLKNNDEDERCKRGD